jgi:uncharacterized protein YjiS (DUF1127 family)
MSTIRSFRLSDLQYLTGERAGSTRLSSGTSLISETFQAISAMLEKRRSRLALLSMTDDQLKDIGLSRADAEREGLRNPWE